MASLQKHPFRTFIFKSVVQSKICVLKQNQLGTTGLMSSKKLWNDIQLMNLVQPSLLQCHLKSLLIYL